MTSALMFYIYNDYILKLDRYRDNIDLYKTSMLFSTSKDFRHLVSVYECNYKDMCFLVERLLELALIKEKEEEKNK